MIKIEGRRTFDLCGPENMMADADIVLRAITNSDDPKLMAARILSQTFNSGYLVALDDVRSGLNAQERELRDGHPAITGMRLAESKIAYVCDQVLEFMTNETG